MRAACSGTRGVRAYRRDGVGVTAPVLSDGVSTMVPGISERSNNVTRFSHLDRLGTNTKTTDAGGNVVDSKQYDAFGLPTQTTNPSGSQAGFASAFGIQEDAETGLKLMGHRYYDPGTGRFITRDPAQDGPNWYAYCDNNPLADVDPEGLSPQKGHGQGGGRGAHKKKGRKPEHKDPVGEKILKAGIAATLAGLGLAAVEIGGGAEAIAGVVMAEGTGGSQGRKISEKGAKQIKFRRQLIKHSNGYDPSDADAHHIGPQRQAFRELVARQYGQEHADELDDGGLFGMWWPRPNHQQREVDYDDALVAWIRNHPDSSFQDFLTFAKWLSRMMRDGRL